MDKTSQRVERNVEAEIYLRARRGFLIAGAVAVRAAAFGDGLMIGLRSTASARLSGRRWSSTLESHGDSSTKGR